MDSTAFRPTRTELSRVQFLATECEIDTSATQRLAKQGVTQWYGMHRAAQRSAEAFALSAAVAGRSVIAAEG